MRCLHPLPLVLGADEHGKIIFNVPCGKCLNCLSTKRQSWAIRMHYEQITSDLTLFVTLTYDDCNLPYDPANSLNFLSKDDVKGFLKRLRINLQRYVDTSARLRYYCAGEYGPTSLRPHYHFIIFLNDDFKGDKLFQNYARLLYSIERAWDKGLVDIQMSQSDGAFSYAAKYLMKEEPPESSPYYDKLIYLYPPFSLKSQGLGKFYIDQYRDYFSKNRLFLTVNGFKVPMPRYFRARLFPRQEKLTEEQLRSLLQDVSKTDDNRYLQCKRNFLMTHDSSELPKFEEDYYRDLSSYIVRYYNSIKSKTREN